MRTESPFSDKSSVSFILTRARGLGVLTFGKIKKIVFEWKICKIGSECWSTLFILSKLNTLSKIVFKNFFMEAFYGVLQMPL